ncbi:MAG TPA: PhzF family phenazine biosynthesis isomerase [Methylomirabilota bacterium]|nr:PhzF family phenazine biosynthesis isomerase [Methylomirabilota bacterium]
MPARVLHYDAFAPRPGMGNPAGVVLDAGDLSDQAMQAIARAVGFNKTAFVLPSTVADLRLRYFTPGHEMDLCGHATVGSFVALHQHGRLPGAGYPRRLTLETRAGVLPVTVEAGGASEPVVIMAQAPARFESFEGDRARLARVLGLGLDDLRADLPVLYGSTGIWTLVVPVHGLGTMRRMRPLTAEFPSALTGQPGASIHPFCVETIHPDAHLQARHFSSPRSGTVEDPVTGTASGVLGAYHLEFIDPDAPAPLVIEQGQEIGRDGRVWVWIERRDGRCHPRVGGTGCFVRELAIEVTHA